MKWRNEECWCSHKVESKKKLIDSCFCLSIILSVCMRGVCGTDPDYYRYCFQLSRLIMIEIEESHFILATNLSLFLF